MTGRRATRRQCGEAMRSSERRSAALPLLLLAQATLASCAAGDVYTLRTVPPDALLEVTGSVPDIAACLLAAYEDDPFRYRVTAEDGTDVRITAFGVPSGRSLRHSRPRFSIEISQTGQGLVRVTLRNAWTLLGPEAEIERLRMRVAGCGPRGAAADMSKCCQRRPGAPGRLPQVERAAHS